MLSRNKNILLCNKVQIIKFRKLNMDTIILCVLYTRPYSNFTSCPKDVFYGSHTHPLSPIFLYYILLSLLQVLSLSWYYHFWVVQASYTLKCRFVWHFFSIRFRLDMFFWQEACDCRYVSWLLMLTLGKVVSSWFLYCKVSNFSFVILQ